MPLTSGLAIKINAAEFLDGPVSGAALFLARSCDLLMFGFLGLVTIGFSRVIPGLSLLRAGAVTIVSWITYLGLAFVWEH